MLQRSRWTLFSGVPMRSCAISVSTHLTGATMLRPYNNLLWNEEAFIKYHTGDPIYLIYISGSGMAQHTQAVGACMLSYESWGQVPIPRRQAC